MIYHVLNKCNIYFQDALISREHLIRAYSDFLASNFIKQDKTITLTFHTGSNCFDIIAILFATFSSMLLDDVNIDDVLESLNIGDMILYKNERYLWGGFGIFHQKEFIVTKDFEAATHFLLEQRKQDKHIGEINSKSMIPISNRNKIVPYYGSSETTDGRGICKKKNIRTDFISTVFGIPISDIQNICSVSSVIVADREVAYKLMNGIKLKYGESRIINLLDIVTASYFTENDEYPFRGNLAKDDPTLKFTEKVSIARDLILDKSGNTTAILFVLDAESMAKGKSELPELIARKSLRYVGLSFDIDSHNSAEIFFSTQTSDLFACTKEFLSCFNEKQQNNTVVNELLCQIKNATSKKINQKILEGSCTWEQYKKAKESLFLIKRCEYDSIEKQEFIIESFSLMNLLTTAVFPIAKILNLFSNGTSVVRTHTPTDRLKKLWELADKLPASLSEKTLIVLELLELLIKQVEPTKYSELKKMLYYSRNRHIAVIVPKAYYIEILISDKTFFIQNVTVTTPNRFDKTIQYDEIIVVGDFTGKHFDIFRTKSAPVVTVLLYSYELPTFEYKRETAQRFEKMLNERVKSETVQNYEIELQHESELEIFNNASREIDFYIDQIRNTNFLKYVTGAAYQNASATGEVTAIGTFFSGEKILFSKFYKALVFEKKNGAVIETEIGKLMPGDTLIFTKRDSFTKNIVDNIYENLTTSRIVSSDVLDAETKVNYWKLVLEEYMKNNNLSFREVSRQLSDMGCKRHELTIRTWLEKDYSIIGPNDVEAFAQIAELTGDESMKADHKSFFEACKLVRSTRRKILALIGQAIIDNIHRGNKKPKDKMLHAVYENVEKLVVIVELETISELPKPIRVSVNLINKPIVEED